MKNMTLKRPDSGPRVSPADRAAIDKYISTNGVRRFETGLSADVHGLQEFLKKNGYEVAIDGARRFFSVKKIGERGKPRRMRQPEVIALVDTLRAEAGPSPISRTPE